MLRLISLNVEGDNHYEKIFPFFQKEKPDVICMQEVFEVDLPRFRAELGMEHKYLATESITEENPYRLTPKGNQGIVIFSRFPIQSSGFEYYETYREPSTGDSAPNSGHRGFLWVDLLVESRMIRIMTTHFTWSPNGSVTDLQRRDLANFLSKIKTFPDHILCGDFNAPRGREIFDTLAGEYSDNIPQHITSSLDKTIHRAGEKLPDFMVDGLFSRGYTVSDVQVIPGISDHCAVTGEIS